MSTSSIEQLAQNMMDEFELRMIWAQNRGRIVVQKFLSSSLAQDVTDRLSEMLSGTGYTSFRTGRTVFIALDYP